MEERYLMSVDFLDNEAADELQRTAPPGIRISRSTLVALSAGSGNEWPSLMIYAAGITAGNEAVKIITKWILEGLREFSKKKVDPGAKTPPKITIQHREIDYEEGAIRRIVEQQIEIR